MEAKENLEREVTIQISACLDTMTTASEFSVLCRFSQETQEEEKINVDHGKMYPMTLFQKEAKHCTELV